MALAIQFVLSASLLQHRPAKTVTSILNALAFGQFIDAHSRTPQLGEAFYLMSDNSATVGRRPFGVSLSTTPGSTCDNCLVMSSSDRPDR